MKLLMKAILQNHHIPVSGWCPTTHSLRQRFGYSYRPDPVPYPTFPASPTTLGADLPPDFPGSRVWRNPGSLPWMLLHVALGRPGEGFWLGQAARVQVVQRRTLKVVQKYIHDIVYFSSPWF